VNLCDDARILNEVMMYEGTKYIAVVSNRTLDKGTLLKIK